MHKHPGRIRFFVGLLMALALPSSAQQRPASDETVVAFVNVHVLPMDAERVLANQTVVVEGQTIVAVGPSDTIDVPDDALEIQGNGTAYLMPGLADMHIHFAQNSASWLPLFLANGVTTVLNLRGAPNHLELRQGVLDGSILGPTIYTSGPFANQPALKTPEDAERVVRAQKKAGYDFVKIHGKLTRETFERLMEVAREENIPVTGHAPRNLSFDAVLEVGMPSIVHAEELLYTYFRKQDANDEARIPELAARAGEAGLWLTPTLSTFGNIVEQWGRQAAVDSALAAPLARYLHPDLIAYWTGDNPYTGRQQGPAWVKGAYRFQFPLVKQLHEAGVRLLTGTDTPLPVLVPGFSLYDEIAVLVEAGLSRFDAIQAATRNPGLHIAELVDPAERFGTVAAGQRADLILLDDNPLDDLAHLKQKRGVMARGRWFPQAALDQLLADLATSYAAMKETPEPPEPTINLSQAELQKFVGVYESSATSNDVIVVLKEGILEGTAGEKTFPLAPVSPVRFRIDGMPGKNYFEFLPQDDAVNQVRVEIQGITPVLMDRKE